MFIRRVFYIAAFNDDTQEHVKGPTAQTSQQNKVTYNRGQTATLQCSFENLGSKPVRSKGVFTYRGIGNSKVVTF